MSRFLAAALAANDHDDRVALTSPGADRDRQPAVHRLRRLGSGRAQVVARRLAHPVHVRDAGRAEPHGDFARRRLSRASRGGSQPRRHRLAELTEAGVVPKRHVDRVRLLEGRRTGDLALVFGGWARRAAHEPRRSRQRAPMVARRRAHRLYERSLREPGRLHRDGSGRTREPAHGGLTLRGLPELVPRRAAPPLCTHGLALGRPRRHGDPGRGRRLSARRRGP